ncbi:hypothetical protein [Flavimarina sp. Hel_I_48]|uniref:hypothetical protein n=1 Tax=Flavimarina sp. Hel_I_48 TaxID=1392488 RepID=UPI00068E10B9|nr:hypothetical protein [Flavimarina sp. Hel_I_48]
MEKVNYIAQLNEVFKRFNEDPKIKQGHITLYLALFQKWNREFFRKTIRVNGREIRKWAKIKSKTTYHAHLKDLVDWGFLEYFPSFKPSVGSCIRMMVYNLKIDTTCDTTTGTTSVQKMDSYPLEPVQKLVPSLKQKNKNLNKQSKRGARLFEKDVIEFFQKNNWPEIEASKFYAYLKSQHSKAPNGVEISNWRKLARNFQENEFKCIKQEERSPISGYVKRMERFRKDDDFRRGQ